MGPEDNTPEWDNQVEMITTTGMNANIITKVELDQVIMLYVFDESFSRSAILQARHNIMEEFLDKTAKLIS